MKRNKLWLASFLFLTSTVSAGPADELKAKLVLLKQFSADFNQIVTTLDGELLQESKGTLQWLQPNQLYWELFEPDEATLIADGEDLWHIDPFVEQVVVMDQQSAEQNNPIILLTDTNSEHWADFTVEQVDSHFVVKAKDDTSPIATLTLWFKGKGLGKLEMKDRQEQVSRWEFSNADFTSIPAPSLFSFELPEGYSLDDQRQ